MLIEILLILFTTMGIILAIMHAADRIAAPLQEMVGLLTYLVRLEQETRFQHGYRHAVMDDTDNWWRSN